MTGCRTKLHIHSTTQIYNHSATNKKQTNKQTQPNHKNSLRLYVFFCKKIVHQLFYDPRARVGTHIGENSHNHPNRNPPKQRGCICIVFGNSCWPTLFPKPRLNMEQAEPGRQHANLSPFIPENTILPGLYRLTFVLTCLALSEAFF